MRRDVACYVSETAGCSEIPGLQPLLRTKRRGRLRRSDCAGPGLRRVRRGRGFGYLDERGRKISDQQTIARINQLPKRPDLLIHTGDLTHLSKPAEFDDADKIISQAKLDVHYVPGEHDIIDEEVKLYKERYGRGSIGQG